LVGDRTVVSVPQKDDPLAVGVEVGLSHPLIFPPPREA
jgi:hypothetical protein